MQQASQVSGTGGGVKTERGGASAAAAGKRRSAVVLDDEDEDASEAEEGVDGDGEDESDAAAEEQDSWPPEFDPQDQLRPLTLPFFRVEQTAAVAGSTALHLEVEQARTRAAAESGAAASKPKAGLSPHMARLPPPPAAALSANSAPTHCSSAFLPAAPAAPTKLLLFQLPTRLPIVASAEAPASAAREASGAGAIAADARATLEHAAAVAAGLASNAALTPNQVTVAKVRALAEYTEASLDPAGASAALRGLGDGRIGTLKLYKSGRCTMVIGDCEFDMSRGVVPRQLQEVARVTGVPAVDWRAGIPSAAEADGIIAAKTQADPLASSQRPGAPAAAVAAAAAAAAAPPAGVATGQYQILGSIAEKIVVTPNVKQLLRQRREQKSG